MLRFVFFDLEETGLWGSAGFASKHPTLRKSTLLVNFSMLSLSAAEYGESWSRLFRD